MRGEGKGGEKRKPWNLTGLGERDQKGGGSFCECRERKSKELELKRTLDQLEGSKTVVMRRIFSGSKKSREGKGVFDSHYRRERKRD